MYPVAPGTLGTFTVNVPAANGSWPVATLTNYSYAVGGTTLTVQIRYTATSGMKASTLSLGELHITGPNSYDQMATYSSVDVSTNGTPRTVTYTAPAPGSTWDPSDTGTYQMSLTASSVTDINNNPHGAKLNAA